MADAEAVRAFEHAAWERAADAYEASFAIATRQFIPALLDAAAVHAGQTVLDIACGPGFAAAAAAARGAQARGMDFSPAMLDVARTRHPGIRFDAGDAEALPYDDACYTAVVSNFGIHHMSDPVLALRQAHRVLRPGGMLAFTIWDAPSRNIAWRLVFDAIRRCGDSSASNVPAPGGGFATAADCSTALRQGGFTGIGTRHVAGVWHLTDAAALLAALRSGTARMAALLKAQKTPALTAMIADIDRAAADHRTADGLAIPIAAVVAFGCKG